MVKVAWLLLMVCFQDGRLHFSEIRYLESNARCEEYGLKQIDMWRSEGMSLDHMNFECVQVVVPEEKP